MVVGVRRDFFEKSVTQDFSRLRLTLAGMKNGFQGCAKTAWRFLRMHYILGGLQATFFKGLAKHGAFEAVTGTCHDRLAHYLCEGDFATLNHSVSFFG